MTHKTEAGTARKQAILRARRLQELKEDIKKEDLSTQDIEAAQREAEDEAEDLELSARLQDLHLWILTKWRDTTGGKKGYEYWYASWREGREGKVRNVYLGSKRRVSREKAFAKALKLKTEALSR